MKLNGQTRSGIYNLKDDNESPRVSFCDMSKDGYIGANLETPIGFIDTLAIPERTMFSARQTSKSFTDQEYITFNFVDYDIGNGLDKDSGTYTVPEDGTYLFTFKAETHEKLGNVIEIRLNNVEQEIIFNQDDNNLSYETVSHAWQPTLKKGDNIRFYVRYGTFFSNSEIHTVFNGVLIKSD